MRILRKTIRLAISRCQREFLRIRGVSGGDGVRLQGRPLLYIAKKGSVSVGRGAVFNSGKSAANTLESRGPVVLRTIFEASRITIGDCVGITSATLSSATSITVGNRVMIGSGVVITDSDHHDLGSGDRRTSGVPSPHPKHAIRIADDVFIGTRALILKGTSLGERCVVGAGAVVSGDFAPGSTIAGNPAREVRASQTKRAT